MHRLEGARTNDTVRHRTAALLLPQAAVALLDENCIETIPGRNCLLQFVLEMQIVQGLNHPNDLAWAYGFDAAVDGTGFVAYADAHGFPA